MTEFSLTKLLGFIHNYITRGITIPSHVLKEIEKISLHYLFRVYFFSNAQIMSSNKMVSELNKSYILYSGSTLDLIGFLKKHFGSKLNYPQLFTTKKKKTNKDIKKLYDKLSFSLPKQELELFYNICKNSNESDPEYKFFKSLFLDKNSKRRNKKKQQELFQEFNIQTEEIQIEKLETKKQPIKESRNISNNNTNMITGNIPEEFLSKDYVLLDVRNEPYSKNILAFFRNIKTGKKTVYKVSKSDFEYLFKPLNENVSVPVLPISQAYVIRNIKPSSGDIVYDNIDPKQKFATDYFYLKGKEEEYKPRILYFDIEVGSGNDINALDTENAPLEITYISISYMDKFYCFVLDYDKMKNEILSGIDNSTKITIYGFNRNEYEMIQTFINFIYELDPDIITAWNGFSYDFPYLFNRAKRLGLTKRGKNIFENNPKYNNINSTFEIEAGKYSNARWTYYILTDMMLVYKSLQRSEKQSWSLKNISKSELSEDKWKIEMPKPNDPIEKWIDYNVRDSETMKLIDEKVSGHYYFFKMMKLAKTYWESTTYSNGLIAGFLSNFAKERGLLLRTINYTSYEDRAKTFFKQVVGGFNQSTVGGLFRWMVDYDASSMYPSLIRTFNIGPNTLRMTIHYEDALSILSETISENAEIDIIYNEVDFLNSKKEKIKVKKLKQIIKDKRYYLLPSGGIFCNHDEEESIYYTILSDLYNKRQYIRKHLLKDENGNTIQSYDIEQLAIKIAMNSFYGVFGYKRFIFYNLTNANSITMTGRFFIKQIILTIEKFYRNLYDNNKEITIDFNLLKENIKDKNFRLPEQDTFMENRFAIYSDTDGVAVKYEDFMKSEDELDLKSQILYLEKYIKQTEDLIIKTCNLSSELLKGEDRSELQFMTFKKEWISYKGIFYGYIKKRYILKTVSLDKETGKIKEKLEFTGVDIKRSEYPQLLKDKLKWILSYLFQYSSKINKDKLFNMIDDVTNEFIKLLKDRKSDLCKVVNFSKDIKSYKNRPQHIDAMLLYNYLMGYNYFKPGVKGKIIYISGIDYEKVPNKKVLKNKISKEYRGNAIAFPYDSEFIPDFVFIDTTTMIQKIWTERYESIFEPVFKSLKDDLSLDDFDFF